MGEQINVPDKSAAGWRLKLGVIIFLLSIIAPLAGIPAVAALDLSVTMKTTVSGVLLIGAEVLGILAIAVMGKQGYLYIKSRFFGFLKRYSPPDEVSRSRYNVGLVMFCIPILFGWISIYAADYIPGFSQNPLPYAIGGDLLLLVSLFVLGGDFWDKIRALFVYDVEVHFPQK
jgi:hypothetical protein